LHCERSSVYITWQLVTAYQQADGLSEHVAEVFGFVVGSEDVQQHGHCTHFDDGLAVLQKAVQDHLPQQDVARDVEVC
jgi:hypothetical protein